MLALITVFAVVLLSLIVTRIATVALTLTGLSRETARFQARSALSGAGFTTSESEDVVNHPVRRRIILALMLFGSAGLVAGVASLAVSFGGADVDQRLRRGLILIGGLFVIWRLAMSAWVDRRLSAVIGRALRARGYHVRDYAHLLELSGDYEVSELLVEEGDWLVGRPLAELRLRDEGVIVLGVNREEGGYLGVPDGRTRFEAGDTLVLYGRGGRIEELDARVPIAMGRPRTRRPSTWIAPTPAGSRERGAGPSRGRVRRRRSVAAWPRTAAALLGGRDSRRCDRRRYPDRAVKRASASAQVFEDRLHGVGPIDPERRGTRR